MKKFSMLCLFLIFMSSTVKAYVPPSQEIIEFAVKKIGTSGSLNVTHQFVLRDNAVSPLPLTITENVTFRFPEYLRAEMVTDQKKKIHIISQKNIVTIIDNTKTEKPETSFDIYKEILLYRDAGLLTQRLNDFGIKTSICSLGKIDKIPCFVIGAKYPDDTSPQFWVEKDTYFPIRLLLTSRSVSSRDTLEIRYGNWQEISKGLWYPKKITYLQNGQVIVEITPIKSVNNAKTTDKMFDVSQFQSIEYKKPVQAGEADMNEVEKTIQDFRNTFQ